MLFRSPHSFRIDHPELTTAAFRVHPRRGFVVLEPRFEKSEVSFAFLRANRDRLVELRLSSRGIDRLVLSVNCMVGPTYGRGLLAQLLDQIFHILLDLR